LVLRFGVQIVISDAIDLSKSMLDSRVVWESDWLHHDVVSHDLGVERPKDTHPPLDKFWRSIPRPITLNRSRLAAALETVGEGEGK
jgi:hypothetical protein